MTSPHQKSGAIIRHVLAVVCVVLLANAAAGAAPGRNGAHDFDYQFGSWKVSVSRLSTAGTVPRWISYTGTHNVTPLWGGRANIGVLEIHGMADHIEGLQLRLYNPSSRTWRLSFASSTDGELQSPMTGAFVNGVADFRDREIVDGKLMVVRSTSTRTSSNSYSDVIERSADDGKTWATVWIARYVRT